LQINDEGNCEFAADAIKDEGEASREMSRGIALELLEV
jgi:hypothetical protein